MMMHCTSLRPALKRWTRRFGMVAALAACAGAPTARAQEEDDYGDDTGSEEAESSFTVNAMAKMQGGLFVPLASDGFSAQQNRASTIVADIDMGACDPVVSPAKSCYPQNHGTNAGSPSISRATLQMEAHWDFSRKLSLHTIIRGARMGTTEQDEYAQVPRLLDRLPGESNEALGARRRDYAKHWVQSNYYNRFELREFYVDYLPLDWLMFRLGRQQVAWGETGSFRMLDVVNPIDSSWHFGPLESFEDQRIPLWMGLATIDVNALKGALELLYIPGLDRARDMVSVPLSNFGAWGVPYSNQPSSYQIRYKDFHYPGGELAPRNMRAGFRWKGDLGDHASYSLVYMYTHMQSPVLQRAYQSPERLPDGTPIPGAYSSQVADRAFFTFPRQHIAGGSLEYVFDSPLGLTARFESSVEPNRTYSQRTDTAGASANGQIVYTPRTKPVYNYALVIQRPTMIRWLNPTQNFLLVGQFMHTHVFNVDDVKDNDLVQAIGYNDWRVQKNAYTLVFYATTNYFHGLFTPRLTGVYVPNPYYQDSGMVSLDLGFRIGPHYRVNVMATDFVGKNPYRDLGMFRDRDEIHASLTVLH
jgi:hypothetical protein